MTELEALVKLLQARVATLEKALSAAIDAMEAEQYKVPTQNERLARARLIAQLKRARDMMP